MNGINPLKPFKDFLPNAPMWLRLTLYILRIAFVMLPAVSAPALVSCIGSTTSIETHIDGNSPNVSTDNNGSITLNARDSVADEAEISYHCLSDDYTYPAY